MASGCHCIAAQLRDPTACYIQRLISVAFRVDHTQGRTRAPPPYLCSSDSCRGGPQLPTALRRTRLSARQEGRHRRASLCRSMACSVMLCVWLGGVFGWRRGSSLEHLPLAPSLAPRTNACSRRSCIREWCEGKEPSLKLSMYSLQPLPGAYLGFCCTPCYFSRYVC